MHHKNSFQVRIPPLHHHPNTQQCTNYLSIIIDYYIIANHIDYTPMLKTSPTVKSLINNTTMDIEITLVINIIIKNWV